MLSELKPAILMTLLFTVLTGLIYPLSITGLAQAFFYRQANGSLVEQNGRIIGSQLIGQNFSKAEYFHPRPSAAGTNGYNAGASGGSNLGPSNPALIDRLTKDAAQFRKDNPDFTGEIPADAITSSGSGLDPDISPANALAQSMRVARARRAEPDAIRKLVEAQTQSRQFGLLGEPRVNVLALNRALDKNFPARP